MLKNGESRGAFIDRMRKGDPEAIIDTRSDVNEDYRRYTEVGFEELTPILLLNSVA